MLSIFEQRHIFVVFNPGSGGNFLAGIINNIVNSNLTFLDISSTGSSHTVLRDKSKGTDFLSFGTFPEEHDLFKSETERESFYYENIKSAYPSETSKPEIIWTHDFTNIPLYRKYFKNAQVLVITTSTEMEHLTALFMLAKKTILDKNSLLPLTPALQDFFNNRWATHCTFQLLRLTTPEEANKMVNDRFNVEYKDILYYATIRMMMNFFGILHLVEPVSKQEDIFNRIINPRDRSVGNKLDYYIDDKCVVLPYRYLADNDSNLLVSKISEVLEQELSNDELNYIRKLFETYRSVQDSQLLANPVEYYKELRRRALNR